MEEVEILKEIVKIVCSNTPVLLPQILMAFNKDNKFDIMTDLETVLSEKQTFLRFIKNKMLSPKSTPDLDGEYMHYENCYQILKDIKKNQPEILDQIVNIAAAHICQLLPYPTAHARMLQLTNNTSVYQLLRKVNSPKSTQNVAKLPTAKPAPVVPEKPKKEINSHFKDLVQLVSNADSDVGFFTKEFREKRDYQVDDFCGTIFRSNDFGLFVLKNAKGCASYRDTKNKPYCPTFAGQTVCDSFNINIRYYSQGTRIKDCEDKCDNPCELINDQDFMTRKIESAYLNEDNNIDHYDDLLYAMTHLYPQQYSKKVFDLVRNSDNVFEKFLKPKLFDVILFHNYNRNVKIDEAYWEMYPNGPMFLAPIKLINKSHNFLFENNAHYVKLCDCLVKILFSHADEAIETGFANANLDGKDVELLEKYIRFYKYFTIKMAPGHIPRGNPSLSFTTFQWDALYTQIINKASRKVDPHIKELSVRNIDFILNTAVEDLVKTMKKKRDEPKSDMLCITWQLADKQINIFLIK